MVIVAEADVNRGARSRTTSYDWKGGDQPGHLIKGKLWAAIYEASAFISVSRTASHVRNGAVIRLLYVPHCIVNLVYALQSRGRVP